MNSLYEASRSAEGVMFLQQHFNHSVEGLADHFGGLHQAARQTPIGITMISLASLMDPQYTHIGQCSAEEFMTQFTTAGPFEFGSLLGLMVVKNYTPELMSRLSHVSLGAALSDQSRPLMLRIDDMRADVIIRGAQGFEEVPQFHDELRRREDELINMFNVRPGMFIAGFGITMFMQLRAWQHSGYKNDVDAVDWDTAYRQIVQPEE